MGRGDPHRLGAQSELAAIQHFTTQGGSMDRKATLRTFIALLAACMLVQTLRADDKSVDFDEDKDFSKYGSFDIRQQVINSKAPALNSSLVKDRIASAIRKELSDDGLFKDPTQPDLIVNYRLGAEVERDVDTFRVGRLGRRRTRVVVDKYTEGTLVIDILERESRDLVWRGIYNDKEGDFAKLARKLEEDVKKLFAEYPPKK
ncbi:MAG: DUF4136 domain-containing protein [Acidobacteria bacterium]|nr:DUF4136 domain-containing protein [Acidobacteriota bacterium]